jgi:hypothetical protein
MADIYNEQIPFLPPEPGAPAHVSASGRNDRVTGIVYYNCRRTAWNESRHTYLIDVGTRIEIPMVVVFPTAESRLLPPPHPETRYFEIEIDEVRDGGRKTFVFQNIFPVQAGRKKDWYFLKFRILKGDWTITERIHAQASDRESQWIYTNDFNILFISSGGRHDIGMLIHLITARLDEIATSAQLGTPLSSQFESQMACRDVLDSMFSGGVEGAFRDTVLYRQHSTPVKRGDPYGKGSLSGADICRNHGRNAAQADPAADMNLNLSQIEELDDLSWLYE